MKKKILFASNSLCIGGIEKSLINLLKIIDYDKFEVDLVLESFDGEFKNDVPKEVNIIEYKIFNIKNKLLQKIKNYLNRIKWILKNKNKYDCAICYATYSYPANILTRISSKNSIIFVHNDYTYVYNENDLTKFVRTRHFDKFRHIIFVSNESKNNFLKYYPELEEKSKVINNIIDVENIVKLSKKKIELNFDKKNINILYVGRLNEEQKNILTQLKLINDLKDYYPNIKLFLLGDGPDKIMYKNYIKNNNLDKYVILLGEKKNPYPYIKNCDYMLLTSNYEGYPVTFNETITLKKDIISTLKISDDFTELGKDYGFLVNMNYLKDEVKNIIDNKLHKQRKININKINKERKRLLEELLDE